MMDREFEFETVDGLKLTYTEFENENEMFVWLEAEAEEARSKGQTMTRKQGETGEVVPFTGYMGI